MMKISVIVGSTRQGRFSEKPAQWILQQLHKREGIETQLLDLRDFPMPFFDQPTPPARPGRPPYEHEVVKKWTAQIAASDGCIRHPGVQLRHLRGAEKRDRLGLSGVEPQGCCLCELRKRHGCASRPAASRDGNRDSNGTDSIICLYSPCDALGTFSGWGRRQGPRRAGEASQHHGRRTDLVDGSSKGGPRALRCGQ
jgi:NADPH-dependent FMN reductase